MTIAFSRTARAIPPNVFERMDGTVAAARARGMDVIDLSKGNPDGFPPPELRAVARAAVDDPVNARYTPFDGKAAFLDAAAGWYAREHGVELDPATQLFAVEGAVDGLAAVFCVLLDPGDAVAFVDPYYPSYHCMAAMLGAEEVRLPARADLGWLPDLDAVERRTWERIRLLVLNYPNNPTGAQAPAGFLARATALASRYGFVVAHDFAYAGLGVERRQSSLLEAPGALETGVEIVSLSKMYAMAGWRAGFVAGAAPVVDAVKRYHYQMGSMITSFVQDAGAAALSGDQGFVRAQAARYAARRAIVANGLRAAGYDVFDSPGGLYVWARARDGRDGDRLADDWLARAGVAALPGSCFGRVGADHVRMSLMCSSERLREAVGRIARLGAGGA